ncbi:hypothetical protein [Schlesneria sp.]|uniref:hypothetical protein n=1 Tax=Schlesneria sp. TaxID=2762018 RepID=UPI002F184DB7
MGNRPQQKMIRVNPDQPCPVCGKPDWCLRSPDGDSAICPRVEEGAIKRAGEAGWFHVLNHNGNWQSPRQSPARYSPPTTPARDWSAAVRGWQTSCGEQLDDLATQLGVTRESLELLGVGYDRVRKCWTFPEKDCNDKIIGILRRDRDGEKKMLPNSRRGLYVPSNWSALPGPMLLVEGASDTAAVLSMELCGIGRPSNTGGVDHLIGLLEDQPLDREIIVVGEWDRKSDGSWPGRTGAESTARQLAQALERPIGWALPPDRSKDTRTWLRTAPQGLPIDRLGGLFLSGLNVHWLSPPPLYSTASQIEPEVSLPCWRDAMLAVRIQHLAVPGCYLDASPTGSGKSLVDVRTLVHATLLEIA